MTARMPGLEPVDVHVVADAVAIRLHGPARSLAGQLERELGTAPAVAPDAGLPALDVTMGPRRPDRGRPRVLGVTDGAFAYDDEAFHLVDGDGRRLTIDLAGPDGFRIHAETGTRRLPLLPALVGLLLVGRDRVLLHAAALRVGEVGLLVPGWQSGGKSEVVLGFAALAARGAGPPVAYLADEWTVVGQDGGLAVGLPTPIQLWAWQLAQVPAIRAGLPSSERRRLAALTAFRWAARRGLGLGRRTAASSGPEDAGGAGGAALRSLAALDGWLRRADRTVVSPAALGMTVERGPLAISAIVLPVISPGESWVRPIPSEEVAARMAGSQAFERRGLDALHAKFRYAFPDRGWPALAEVADREEGMLRRALAGIPAVEVAHPYPVDLAAFAREVAAAVGIRR